MGTACAAWRDLTKGHYVGVVVDGKVTFYGRSKLDLAAE
jgi:hypothetical protein